MTDATQHLKQHFATTYDAWVRIADTFKGNIARLKEDSFLAERPATKFILAWMRELGEFQTQFGKLFGRIKRPPKADEFTAAVAICLEQFLAARGLAGRVGSEETTHRAKGAKRPDISVYSLSGQRVATVECKTNLGWTRKNWKDQIGKRTKQLRASCPSSESFFCILTRSNWDYSEFERSPQCGKQWFCLSAVPVGRISDPVADSDILVPIEPMFLDILAKVRGGFVEQIRQMAPDDQQKVLRSLEEKGGNP
jgi:hypothetical protein